jgi:hypothetical protein
VRSYTVTLTSNQQFGLPQVLDHYLFLDPISGVNFVYPASADDGDFTYSTGQPTVTADDGAFSPWGYLIQDVITNITVGPLKGPYTVVFDPTGLDTRSLAIQKIIYNFGDGSPETIINRSIVPQYTLGQTASAGNPETVIVSHDYYPQSNTGVTIFTPSITAFNSNLVRSVFNITISSAPISIYEFDDIHLINNTQQLKTVETQNIFEIDNPDYLTVARVISATDANYPTVIPFDPNTSVLNYDLITWLDASDATTIGKDQNDKVYVWYDKSGYKNNYFNDSGNPANVGNPTANSPTYLNARSSKSGRNCVSFQKKPIPINGSNGTPQYLYSLASGNLGDKVFYTWGQGFTVFAVMKLNQIGSQDTLFAYDLNTNEDLRNTNGDGLNYLPFMNVSFGGDNSMTIEQGDTSYYFGTSAYDPNKGIYQPTTTGTISQNLTSYSLFSFTANGNKNASAYFTADTAIIKRNYTNTPPPNYQNSYSTLSSFLSGGYNSATGITVPAGEYDYSLVYGLLGTSDAYYGSYLTDAEISEFMVFDRPLSPSETTQVQTYLVNKWGLTLQTN